jgi:hypothetical protein
VLCGDGSRRFLVFAAADLQQEAIAVPSVFLLLGDVEFYLARTRSLRALLGGVVLSGGRELGELRDLRLARDGAVEVLVAEEDGSVREVPPTDATVAPERVSAA